MIFALGLFLLFGVGFLWDFFAVSDYSFASCSRELEAVDPLCTKACYPSEVLGKVSGFNK